MARQPGGKHALSFLRLSPFRKLLRGFPQILARQKGSCPWIPCCSLGGKYRTGKTGTARGCHETLFYVGESVVSSSLTFAGLTEADARSMESDLLQGLADSIVGVSAPFVRRCQ